GGDLDREAAAQQRGQLAEIVFRYQDLAETPKDSFDIPRQRIEVAQVKVSHSVTLVMGLSDGSDNRTVSAAPADHQQVSFAGTLHFGQWNILGNARDLPAPQFQHAP